MVEKTRKKTDYTRGQAIRHACLTVGIAYHSIGDYEHPSDGFCDNCPAEHIANYQNHGDALRFVRQAVLEKMVREGISVDERFRSAAENLDSTI